jgi:UDP:flavonoid glycosyltransferase YjiC (YdhE family)
VRILIGAFGDPGHAFPAIALGKRLVERGNEVLLQTWSKWHDDAEREGMSFSAAPEYHVFPTRDRPLKPYEAVVRAATDTRPLVREFDPDLVVNDILTLAPALAAELEGRRRATVIPHVYPPAAPGLPQYGLGAMPPTTGLGRAFWRGLARPLNIGVERGRRELNESRRRLGLPPIDHSYGGISHDLTLVATFPQLEYPREWPNHVEVCGPLQWEPPADPVDPPPGEAPLVLIAPSTSQDPEQHLLRASLEGLARLPVRVLATHNRRPPPTPIDVPANARLVDWVSYSQTMPIADLIVCHGGHGTIARALSCGKPLVVVPAAGDMAENATRVAWSGAGVGLPTRFATPTTVRWAVQRVLESPEIAARAREIGVWCTAHDGVERAAALVEELAARDGGQSSGASSRANASSRS